MKKLYLLLLILLFLCAGCGAENSAVPTSTFTPVFVPDVTETTPPTLAPTYTPVPQESPVPTPIAELFSVQPFTVNLQTPFSSEPLVLNTWEPDGPYNVAGYSLPISSGAIKNPEVLTGLTADQRAFLYRNGFVVVHSQEDTFLKIREEVAWFQGQPYFLSVDSALHAFHLTFQELLKDIERQLSPQMADLVKATMRVALEDLEALRGTPIEEDARIAVEYLGVALRLFDPQASIPAEFEGIVEEQVALIMAAQNQAESLVVPGFLDDYGAYKPVGHYAGDPELENYFRGMTWLGRVHFKLDNAENSLRTPLLITLALRRAKVGGQTGAEVWADVHELLTFLIGPMDDAGPAEYAVLMDQVYGTELTILDLAAEAHWAEFVAQKDQIPSPQINSTFVAWVSTGLEDEHGWRFMGQRFTLDGMIFQNLIFDMVQQTEEGDRRMFPSGLDVMATFGSDEAYNALESAGLTDYPNYDEQLGLMQEAVAAQTKEEWQSKFYDSWLYTFFPIIDEKGNAYPPFMQTEAWAYREINAALGSWAQLKHDTVLYSKMPDAAGGGGPPSSGPAPGYVEPNPDAFYRLGYLYNMLMSGLRERGFNFYTRSDPFTEIGAIAEKELRGEPLDDDDYWTIQYCLGLQECSGTASQYLRTDDPKPVPVVAAVSGGGDSVLEVGIGYVDRIYVVVPIDGKLYVSQGGVFSYYEFIQPRNERLTDEEWRAQLAAGTPTQPTWTGNFVLPGGEPVFQTAFRLGDVYLITEEGANLNLRAAPGLDAEILAQLSSGYLEIIDGPVVKDGYTWWKVRLDFVRGVDVDEGWVVQNQEWYERAWGQ